MAFTLPRCTLPDRQTTRLAIRVGPMGPSAVGFVWPGRIPRCSHRRPQ